MYRRYADHVSDRRPNMKRFAELLDQTAVLSDDWKAQLYSWAQAAVQEAYEEALEKGKQSTNV